MRVNKYHRLIIEPFVYQFHLLNLAKTASELGFHFSFWNLVCLWVQLKKNMEICRGILDNWFGKPLALSFPNTPWITEKIWFTKKTFLLTWQCVKKKYWVWVRNLNSKLLIQGVFWKDNAKDFPNQVSKIPLHISKWVEISLKDTPNKN